MMKAAEQRQAAPGRQRGAGCVIGVGGGEGGLRKKEGAAATDEHEQGVGCLELAVFVWWWRVRRRMTTDDDGGAIRFFIYAALQQAARAAAVGVGRALVMVV